MNELKQNLSAVTEMFDLSNTARAHGTARQTEALRTIKFCYALSSKKANMA